MLQQNSHHCSYCLFRSRSKLTLIQHLFDAHSDEEFSYTCEIVLCGHVFASGSCYSGYHTHCHRKHANWKQQIEEIAFDNSMDVGDVPLCSADCNKINNGQNDKEENIELISAQFLLTLKEKYKLSQVTLDLIMDSISKLVKIISRNVKFSVLEKLKK